VENEVARSSPLYAHLSTVVAAQPRLGRPLLAAPRPQQRANLLFAVVQYLLATVAPGHPLARYYPTLGGTQPADAGLPRVFAGFRDEFAGPLSDLCAGRTT
jgi:hypothetical protein